MSQTPSSASHALPPTIDPIAAARWESLPVRDKESPWLHEEIGRRMDERLDWIKLQPGHWLDWQPMRGGIAAHSLVKKRYPKAGVSVVENPAREEALRSLLANPWWSPAKWTAAPTRFGMPADGSVDMLWANMALHMSADPESLIAQWHRLLAKDGFLMFSCLGPDTIREIRGLYEELGWPTTGHEFTDMHDWGDMLVHAGFAEPVMDMERITLTYTDPEKLIGELRSVGRNLNPGRYPALRGKSWRAEFVRALEARLQQGGPLSLTFEVIYGHAMKPAPGLRIQSETTVQLDEIRAMLKGSRSGNTG